MKTIGRFLLLTIFMVSGTLISCTDYQDEIDALKYRVTVLEDLIKKLNNDIISMQVIVNAFEDGDFITDVTETPDGYIITFNEYGAVVIHDGTDGKDGKDAQIPDIAVKQGEDGYYYWVINGEWLTGPNGQKIRSNGKDGKDGVDGKDGKAIAPQVRINDVTGMWEISTDEGKTWVSTGTPVTGKDGKDGKDANTIANVVTHWNEGYVEFITSSGTFRIPLQ